jgi:hypothetical protein
VISIEWKIKRKATAPQAEALWLILSAPYPRIVKVIAERPGLAAA